MNTIIQTVITISSIAALLALLLSIANKTIANYGEKKLLINDNKEYIVEGGETLLSSLTEEKIFIPSACGGKGSCGYCKVQVLEGGGPILPTELGYVSEEERKDNIRLSCQLKVKEDLKIHIPEELFNIQEYQCKVSFISDVTPKIKHVGIELSQGDEIEFKPGQYIQILVPQYEGNNEEIYRAYSIASSPSIKNGIELFIGYTGGTATTYVHKHLKVGDEITLVGPFGDFYYQSNEREMVMVAAGTGMAPILSILEYMKDNNITNRKVTYHFGARHIEDLYVLDKIEEIKNSLPNFTFIPCLSRPSDDCGWTGDIGRVTDTLEKYLSNGENVDAYLCGSPKMIASVKDVLNAKGVPEELIYYDEFE